MNKILGCILAAGVLLCGSTVLAGCNKQTVPMRTGTINSTVILQNDDEYQKLSQEYFAERIKAAAEVERLVKEHSGKDGVLKDKSIYGKLLKIQNDVESKWQKRTAEYVSKKMDSMRTACEAVAAEKQLDLVLIDSDDVPTIEFGAHDITADAMGKMPGFAGGNAPAADAKSAPKSGK